MALAFGTSGIRGLATELNDEVCERYARAFVRHCRSILHPAPSHWIIAGDLRESSPRIAAAIASGVFKEGGAVLDAGMIPTPALAYGCYKRNVPGIMVTGSHIPADRNGIKFYFPHGEILKSDEIPILKHFADLEKADSSSLNEVSNKVDLATPFVERYARYFGRDLLKGRNVVLYEHSSAARDVLKQILISVGANVVCHDRRDSFIPVDTEALGDVSGFQKIISNSSAMALVSTDGDGDRPMILDEIGNVVRGDQIGVLSAAAVRADGVATPISSSTALEKTGVFKTIRRTKIGSPYVVEGMQILANGGLETIVGYEANGGLLLGSDLANGASGILTRLMTRDSILPILLLLKGAVSHGVSVSKFVSSLPQRFTASELIRDFAPEKSRALLDKFLKGGLPFFTHAWEKELGNAIYLDRTDGVRVEFESGFILHFRPSGNAPEFRIYSEAETETGATMLVQKAKEFVKSESAVTNNRAGLPN
jgi:phosphomannomutase